MTKSNLSNLSTRVKKALKHGGITKGSIRRMARRAGVKRISGPAYAEIRGALTTFVEGVIKDAIVYTEHAKRHTVTAVDVVYALRKRGKMVYGYT
jgi:histone H4